MRIIVDRRFGREVYLVVKRWRRVYRHFNRLFCNGSRPISFAIGDEYFIRPIFE